MNEREAVSLKTGGRLFLDISSSFHFISLLIFGWNFRMRRSGSGNAAMS